MRSTGCTPLGGGKAICPWQCLYFRPEPHGQGALRLTGASANSPSVALAPASGCGMFSGGRFDRIAPVAASMSAVSSSPENGSMCCVMKSGSTGGRRILKLDLRHASATRVTSSRIDDEQALEQ